MLADVKEWLREEPRQALALGISAVALLLSFLELVPGPVDPAWLAVLLCGVPIIKCLVFTSFLFFLRNLFLLLS